MTHIATSTKAPKIKQFWKAQCWTHWNQRDPIKHATFMCNSWCRPVFEPRTMMSPCFASRNITGLTKTVLFLIKYVQRLCGLIMGKPETCPKTTQFCLQNINFILFFTENYDASSTYHVARFFTGKHDCRSVHNQWTYMSPGLAPRNTAVARF